MRITTWTSFAVVSLAVGLLFVGEPACGQIRLQPIGRFQHGSFAKEAAEIAAYHAGSRRLFVTNGEKCAIDVLDIQNPAEPKLIRALDLTTHGSGVNSVAVHGDSVAVAVLGEPPEGPGKVVFFDPDGKFLSSVSVGAWPDMVCFTPDGKTVLTADEGQPSDDYTDDPEGSVSLVDVSGGVRGLGQGHVTTLDFRAFNDRKGLDPSIRIYGPGATVAEDLEPEYVAVAADSRTAWVTLQENNALAVVDLTAKKITRLIGLGFKDHNKPGAGLDASDKDGQINIRPWPLKGMYQPDTIVAFQADGKTYLITSNEGGLREYAGFRETVRVGKLKLDARAFPYAAVLQSESGLGRLKTSSEIGDADGDGLREEIYGFGGRSFAIWTAEGRLVYDSGDQFEQVTARMVPKGFNSTMYENDSFDRRSDDKGPEPEGIALGKLGGRTYAFIGLERVGGVIVFDITNPIRPTFATYVNTRDFQGDPERGTAGDLAPEGLVFIPAGASPIQAPLLVAAYEVSGTTRIFKIIGP